MVCVQPPCCSALSWPFQMGQLTLEVTRGQADNSRMAQDWLLCMQNSRWVKRQQVPLKKIMKESRTKPNNITRVLHKNIILTLTEVPTIPCMRRCRCSCVLNVWNGSMSAHYFVYIYILILCLYTWLGWWAKENCLSWTFSDNKVWFDLNPSYI